RYRNIDIRFGFQNARLVAIISGLIGCYDYGVIAILDIGAVHPIWPIGWHVGLAPPKHLKDIRRRPGRVIPILLTPSQADTILNIVRQPAIQIRPEIDLLARGGALLLDTILIILPAGNEILQRLLSARDTNLCRPLGRSRLA